MKKKPKLFIKISAEENNMTLELENQPPAGLEVVIVTSKEVKSFHLYNGDSLKVTPGKEE